MSRFKAIIFDFDGVISDSLDVKTQAFRRDVPALRERDRERKLLTITNITVEYPVMINSESIMGIFLASRSMKRK